MNLRFNRTHLVALLIVLLFSLGVATVAAVPGDYTAVYVSAGGAGTTEDGLAYQPGDIIGSLGPGQPWFTYFEAAAHGLGGKNINAFDLHLTETTVTDVVSEPVYMSFSQSRVRLPGVSGPNGLATPNDIVKFSPLVPTAAGDSFELFFDGSDVGLSGRDEQIDSLSVWLPEDFAPAAVGVPQDCTAGLLFITTAANYRVRDANGVSMPGKGGDILAFCATNLGPNTAGFWFRAFSATEAGFSPLRAIRNLTVHNFAYNSGTGDWELRFSFSSRTDFHMGAFTGYANNVYLMDTTAGDPILELDLNTDYPTLNGSADGLEIVPYTSVCANDC
ncbi:MAG TPA: hypothetical protein PK829_07090 [Promineifilum sp.]|nr:hypothetical protein [Promineifilum sp.]HQF70626.1 hypothetical protein [Promineifilum sp.]